MSKIFINTLDVKKEFSYESAHIFTENYKIKIRKNELHAPLAAKVIIESDNKIYSFILKQPIIKVDDMREIHIWSPSKFEDASYEKHVVPTELEKKQIKRHIKLLKAKAQMGLTPEEVAEYIESASDFEMLKLRDKKIDPMIGGGF